MHPFPIENMSWKVDWTYSHYDPKKRLYTPCLNVPGSFWHSQASDWKERFQARFENIERILIVRNAVWKPHYLTSITSCWCQARFQTFRQLIVGPCKTPQAWRKFLLGQNKLQRRSNKSQLRRTKFFLIHVRESIVLGGIQTNLMFSVWGLWLSGFLTCSGERKNTRESSNLVKTTAKLDKTSPNSNITTPSLCCLADSPYSLCNEERQQSQTIDKKDRHRVNLSTTECDIDWSTTDLAAY